MVLVETQWHRRYWIHLMIIDQTVRLLQVSIQIIQWIMEMIEWLNAKESDESNDEIIIESLR